MEIYLRKGRINLKTRRGNKTISVFLFTVITTIIRCTQCLQSNKQKPFNIKVKTIKIQGIDWQSNTFKLTTMHLKTHV